MPGLNLYQLNEKWMFIFHFPLFLQKPKMTVVTAVSLLQSNLVRFMWCERGRCGLHFEFSITQYSYTPVFHKNVITKYFSAVGDCCYVLYAQQDSKVRSDDIVQRITKDKVEFFAIMKQTINNFFCLLSEVNAWKILAITMINYLLYNDKKNKVHLKSI